MDKKQYVDDTDILITPDIYPYGIRFSDIGNDTIINEGLPLWKD